MIELSPSFLVPVRNSLRSRAPVRRIDPEGPARRHVPVFRCANQRRTFPLLKRDDPHRCAAHVSGSRSFVAEARLAVRQQEPERQRGHVDRPVEIAEVVLRLLVRERPHARRDRQAAVAQHPQQPPALARYRLAVDLEDLPHAKPQPSRGSVVHDREVGFQGALPFLDPRAWNQRGRRRQLRAGALDLHSSATIELSCAWYSVA